MTLSKQEVGRQYCHNEPKQKAILSTPPPVSALTPSAKAVQKKPGLNGSPEGMGKVFHKVSVITKKALLLVASQSCFWGQGHPERGLSWQSQITRRHRWEKMALRMPRTQITYGFDSPILSPSPPRPDAAVPLEHACIPPCMRACVCVCDEVSSG